jgi:hypothetical protein
MRTVKEVFMVGSAVGLGVGYNHRMPTPQRPERVNIKVTKSAKETALAIASAMSTKEVKWKETDAWEQAIAYLATRKDVRDALAKASQPSEEG